MTAGWVKIFCAQRGAENKETSLAENRTQISRLTVGLPNRWKTRDNMVVYGLIILFVI